MSRFREALQSGRVLLMDGAMGTELQRAGLQPGECGEFWNLTKPEAVRAIHEAYVDAGARCLLTNTFQANPTALAKHGKSEQLESINRAALGVNCGREIGMSEIIQIVRRYRQVTDLPLFARPNAGTPERSAKRWLHPQTPADMAARLPELLETGLAMIGGCCGTTPAHIA